MSDEMWAGLTICGDHEKGGEPGCEACQAEFAEVQKRLQAKGQSVMDRMNGLAQQGIVMPPHIPVEIRLMVLCEILMGDNPRQQGIFEAEVIERVLASVKNMQEQIKAPTLHVARGNVSDIIRKG